MKKIGITMIFEREMVGKKERIIASSPDINVFAEGDSVEEAKKSFLEGVKSHLEEFPEEKKCLIKEEEQELETPMISRIFL